MNIPSAAPWSTTFVSPVTIRTPAPSAAAAMSPTIARNSSIEKPSSSTNAADNHSGLAPMTARSLTVPCTARCPIEPPGKRSGFTTNESVVNARRSPLGSARRRGVIERPALVPVVERIEEHGVEQRGRRLAAGTVCQCHDLVGEAGPAPAERLDALEHGRFAIVRCGRVINHHRPPLSVDLESRPTAHSRAPPASPGSGARCRNGRRGNVARTRCRRCRPRRNRRSRR